MSDNDFTDLPYMAASVILVPPGHPEYVPPPHESDEHIHADLKALEFMAKLVLAKVVAGASIPPPGQRLIEYDITPPRPRWGPTFTQLWETA